MLRVSRTQEILSPM